MKKRKLYIEKLFDYVNGGDDVDAAEEAQEITEELLHCLTELKYIYDHKHERDCKEAHCVWLEVEAAISRAKGGSKP